MADEQADATLQRVRERLGPELEYLAEPLAPVMKEIAEDVAQAAAADALRPVRAQHEALITHAAQEQTQAVMEAFSKKHPDWPQHEDALFALAQKIAPLGMSELEYLDHLYTLVTRQAWEQTREQDIAEGVKKALAGEREDATEEPSKFVQAFRAAQRGERWEDRGAHHASPEPSFTRDLKEAGKSRPPQGRPPTLTEAYEAAKRGERWE